MNAVKSSQRPEQSVQRDCRNQEAPSGPTSLRATPQPRSHTKNVLQLRLQQRRTREQLADQGIMPPLKSPAAFHEQRRSLERSKTGDYLKHKIGSRPEKSELISMHILQDSAVEGSAQEPPNKLRRARLADDLNEKIALRPGPLELVEKNIIPVDSSLKEAAVKANHGKFPKQEDSYAFEEDSGSESLSPEHPLSDESQSSAGALAESKASSAPSPSQGSHENATQNHEESSSVPPTQTVPAIRVPAIIKSKTSDKSRPKKPKDVKPKVKKLKYHQYIPPDQKAEKSPPPMDSAYARLLQQQQLFLQLQILSQQKQQQQGTRQPATAQSFGYGPPQQNPLAKQAGERDAPDGSGSTSPVKSSYCGPAGVSPVRPGPLPANLDDLKVSELRQQLRIRGLPVSGTKTALIERLRPYKDPSCSSPSSSGDITTVTFPVTPTGSSYQSPGSTMSHTGGYYPFCSTGSTPPISPASSDLSVGGSLPDSFSDVALSSPRFGLQPSPTPPSADESPAAGGCPHGDAPEGLDTEKDKMLVEKQKVIEELTWKLHQEQRQVEELRMQLHKRKRTHGGPPEPPPPPHPLRPQPPAHMQQHFFGVSVKQEHVASSCPLASKQPKCGPPGSCIEGMGHCGLGGPASGSPSGLSAYLSPQCSPQDSPVTKSSSSPQPSSLPSSPSHPYLLTPPLGRDSCSHPLPHGGARPHPMQLQQKGACQPVSCSYAPDQRSMQPMYENSLMTRGSPKVKTPDMQAKMALLHCGRHIGHKCDFSSTALCSSASPASAVRQPPCYEDAVQQQMTRSQQMDELLDVLIESGVPPSSAGAAAIPKFHRHYGHVAASMMPYEHAAADCHLEVLLGSPMTRPGDIMPLKMAAEDAPLEEVGEGFAGHRHDDKLLGNRDMMDTPLSPMATKVSPVATDSQGLGMTYTESPWEAMEWLDLTPPSSATAFGSGMPPAGPSIFNTEFLDVTDINLNSAMDLHLEHW
ncbi:myocardin isoform X3 [Electrophorus electricus]|uniref:myocardin isoform X3 n=1 Tax=Electrophorus electricus TaxID=8005 RepID=UPI0015CFA67E|nr:myocardin isoform X3 [Electrophorus electricus]